MKKMKICWMLSVCLLSGLSCHSVLLAQETTNSPTEKEVTNTTAEEFFAKGAEFYQNHNYEEALSEFNKAISAKPDYVEAYYNLGITYWQLKEYQIAIKVFEKVKELAPNSEVAKNADSDIKKLSSFVSEKNKELEKNQETIKQEQNVPEPSVESVIPTQTPIIAPVATPAEPEVNTEAERSAEDNSVVWLIWFAVILGLLALWFSFWYYLVKTPRNVVRNFEDSHEKDYYQSELKKEYSRIATQTPSSLLPAMEGAVGGLLLGPLGMLAGLLHGESVSSHQTGTFEETFEETVDPPKNLTREELFDIYLKSKKTLNEWTRQWKEFGASSNLNMSYNIGETTYSYPLDLDTFLRVRAGIETCEKQHPSFKMQNTLEECQITPEEEKTLVLIEKHLRKKYDDWQASKDKGSLHSLQNSYEAVRIKIEEVKDYIMNHPVRSNFSSSKFGGRPLDKLLELGISRASLEQKSHEAIEKYNLAKNSGEG